MKIEVGKTYTSENGMQWYIECQLKHSTSFIKNTAGTYLATRADNRGGITLFKECGACLDNPKQNLKPNMVKKEGWIARSIDGRIAERDRVGMWIHDTEADIRRKYPSAMSYHKIEWEEEEA